MQISEVSEDRYYVATYSTTRGPWIVVDKETGKVISQYESPTEADNAAYRLSRVAAS